MIAARLISLAAPAAMLLALAACSDSTSTSSSTPAAPVSASATPSPSQSPRAATATGVNLTKVRQAAVEEECDNLAAARFKQQHATHPVFVNPSFDAGRDGIVIVTQDIPFTDVAGVMRTASMYCQGTLNADNTVSADLVALVTK